MWARGYFFATVGAVDEVGYARPARSAAIDGQSPPGASRSWMRDSDRQTNIVNESVTVAFSTGDSPGPRIVTWRRACVMDNPFYDSGTGTIQGGVRSGRKMERHAAVILYVLALVAVVVAVDVLFFENRLWQRLMVNVGIVLIFGAFFLRFLKRP